MSKNYAALRTVASINEVLGIVIMVVSACVSLYGVSKEPQLIAGGIGGLFIGLSTYASGQYLRLMMAIEANTRLLMDVEANTQLLKSIEINTRLLMHIEANTRSHP